MTSATISLPITIAPNLYLRQAGIADAPAVFNLINTHRNYLRQWLPFIDQSQSVKDTEHFLRSVTAPGNRSDLVFAILYEEEVVGIIGYKQIDYVNQKLEIGYWLGEPYQGKGIMLRSCAALVRHAFNSMNMNRVQINVGVGNEKSSNIPKKLGFVFEGIERDGELLHGRFHDLENYSLLKREWQAQEG
ncbi:GNAT family N-acetyltransferase [Pontibacter ruber]|uniref:GNAT family N-acetyltransferase n=1 Tax=Pontibacter ruber TaxID=1343895 RepID=A0ABW5CXJ5_9BACT|nr:GNAT family protein [Pontibacter ruber]